MGNFVGGTIKEITYNHPTLGSGTIYPKADADGTFDTGGITSADSKSDIAGNGKMIDKMTVARWGLEVECAWDMADVNELDKMKDLAASPVPSDWTISHIGGSVWKGSGKPVGDLEGNAGASTFKLKLAGSDRLKRLA